MRKIILLTTVFVSCLTMLYAQPGKLDSSFGTNGIVRADLGIKMENNSSARQVLLAGDGSVCVLLDNLIAKGNQTVLRISLLVLTATLLPQRNTLCRQPFSPMEK